MKNIERKQRILVTCTLIEKKLIQAKAKSLRLTYAGYLRQLGLDEKIDKSIKVLPRDVLEIIGELNQLAASLNVIAQKRNREEELNALERATVQQLVPQIRQLAKDIKSYLE